MANRTVKDAGYIKGTNPQYLIEKIIRSRIYDSRFWKEECFALSAELIVDKAMELKYIGGVYAGNVKPTPFICLVLKLLQIQPQKDIIIEFIKNEDYKYVRALGAYYMRLVGTSADIYKYLEPLYNDFRKLRYQNTEGRYELLHMDELIDQLIHEERVCSVQLPRLQKREVLEVSEELEPRMSALDEDLEDMDSDTSDEETEELIKEVQKQERKLPGKQDSRDGHRPIHRSQRSPSPLAYRDRRRHDDRDRRETDDRKRREARYDDGRRFHRERSRTPERRRHRGKGEDERGGRERRHGGRGEEEKRHRGEEGRRHKEETRRKEGHGDRGERSGKKRRHGDHNDESEEIRQANELRAKLGMAPLRP